MWDGIVETSRSLAAAMIERKERFENIALDFLLAR